MRRLWSADELGKFWPLLPEDLTLVAALPDTGKLGLATQARRCGRHRNIAHVYMNRQPIGGYTGYVVLAPTGTKPPPVSEMQPMRPDDHGGDEEAEG